MRPLIRTSIFGFCVSVFTLSTYGIQEVVLNVPVKMFHRYINHSYQDQFQLVPNDIVLSSIWGGIVSAMSVGAILGAALSGSIADRFGRKFCLFGLSNVVAIFGSVFMYLSDRVNCFEFLMIGRLVLGFNVGISTALTPVYLVECSPVRHRGLIANFQPLCGYLIMFLTLAISLPEVLGNELFWSILLSIQAVPAIFCLCIYKWLPESPSYLYVYRRDKKEAKRCIQKIQGDLPQVELEAIFLAYDLERDVATKQMSVRTVLKSKPLRRSAILAFVIGAVRSFCGNGVVHAYSTELFRLAGAPEKIASRSSLALGAAVLPCALSGILVDKVGRKKLFVFGTLTIIFGWCVVFAVSFVPGVASTTISLATTLLEFSIVFPIGPGAIGWYLAAELVPVQARAAVSAICCTTIWSGFLLSVSIYPILSAAIGSYSILIQFVVPLCVGLLYLHLKLPETRRCLPSEISNLLDSPDPSPIKGEDEVFDYGTFS